MPDEMQDVEAEADAPETPQSKPDTFSREYVQRIRAEAKAERLKLQERLKQAEERAAQGAPADDKLSKLEKLLEDERAQREAAAREAAEAKREALRLRVATEVGLPAALASRLSGEDEAALRADAESLKALVATPPTGPQRPGPATTAVPGGSPQGETDAQRRARLGYG